MPGIGDFLPQHLKDELAKNNLVKGAVLKTFVKDTHPPKEKYFIFIGFSADKIAVATIYINSEINPVIFKTEELKKFHLQLKASDYNFLQYDSFADCTQIHEKTYSDLIALLQRTPAAHVGSLTEIDHQQVRLHIKATRLISVTVKKKFGLFF
jgi:hypothetical protein